MKSVAFVSLILYLGAACSDAKDSAESQREAIATAERAREAAQVALEEARRKAAEQGVAVPEAVAPPPVAGPGQPANIAEAMRKMQEVFAQPGQGGTVAVEPRPFQELKALLPEELAGLRRTEVSGERTRMMAISVSFARAEYKNDANGRLKIKITDSGSMQGWAAMASWGWAMTDVERETEHGYERTVSFQGNRGLEKFDSRSSRGELNFIMGNRYIIEADGRDLTMDQIKQALQAIDLSALR